MTHKIIPLLLGFLSGILALVALAWLQQIVFTPRVVRCDGGEGQTPLITESMEWD